MTVTQSPWLTLGFGLRPGRHCPPSARIEWPWAVTVIMMPILWMRTWRPRGVMCLPKVMQPVPLPASPFLVFPPWRQELLSPSPPGVRGPSEDRAGASVPPIPELPLPSGRTTGHLLPAPPAPLSRFPGREPGTLPWWSRRAQQSVPEPPWRPRSPGQLQLLPGAPSHVVSEASAPAPPAPPKNEPV